MNKNEFIERLADYCEFENNGLTLDSQLKDVEGYDSMAVMSMIAFSDENFGVKLTADQIANLSDFNSVIALIGEEKFNG